MSVRHHHRGSRAARPSPTQKNGQLPQPQAAKPQPQAAKPQPQAAKPQPQAAKPQPQAAKPQPQAAKPQPQAAKPQPQAAKPQPQAAKPRSLDRGRETRWPRIPSSERPRLTSLFLNTGVPDVSRFARSNSPARTPDTNARHSEDVNFRIYGILCFESLTRIDSLERATSTQSPVALAELFRHERAIA